MKIEVYFQLQVGVLTFRIVSLTWRLQVSSVFLFEDSVFYHPLRISHYYDARIERLRSPD